MDEFVDGIMRCRGQARAVDQVAMRAELRQLDAKVVQLLQALRILCGKSHSRCCDLSSRPSRSASI